MRPVINSTNVSLDGLIGDLERWHLDYVDEASERMASELLFSCDALLLGRRTYERLAAGWSSRTDELADKLNSMRKYVVSTTLRQAAWHNTAIISREPAQTIATIKERPGGPILTYGFGRLTQALLRHALLDEVRLCLHPVLVGDLTAGATLFRDGNASRLTLLQTRVLDSGVVVLTYRPACVRAAPAGSPVVWRDGYTDGSSTAR